MINPFKQSSKLNPKIVLLFLGDIALNAAIIIAMVYLIRTYLIAPFQIYGPSMCDTLNKYEDNCVRGYGEYIIINKFGYQNFFGWKVSTPHRGDIVVFHPPHSKTDFYIKRVIGLPGETVELKDGYVYIKNEEFPEGLKLEEPYLSAENQGKTKDFGVTTFKIPENRYFVLGDNRHASTDSRTCFLDPAYKGCKTNSDNAYLTDQMIQGKAWVVLWPLNRIRLVPEVGYAME